MPIFTHGLIMKAGGKLAEGTLDRVLKSDLLSKAFDTEMQLQRKGERYALKVKSDPRVIV